MFLKKICEGSIQEMAKGASVKREISFSWFWISFHERVPSGGNTCP